MLLEYHDGIGVYQNYAPEQPIKFSHKLHAGENGVDCNYCHTSARHSKHSSIPSASLCMNCHTYINEGPSGKKRFRKYMMLLVMILKKDNTLKVTKKSP